MSETSVSAGLTVRGPAPDWFRDALARPTTSHRVEVEGCPIHYLRWADGPARMDGPGRGLLFVHGGGAHAHWWSYIAPFFAGPFRVAAMDLSGMGDSGRRPQYSARQRAEELRAVLADAGLGPKPFVIGHSFGGYMSMVFGRHYGDQVSGIVIADSPVRPPAMEAGRRRRALSGQKRVYADFEEGVRRFRLVPEQPCENSFIVEHIARHSLAPADGGGWTWKFDEEAMAPKRFDEPFGEHLAALTCRRALIHGELSALCTPEVVAHMRTLLGPGAPVIELPQARHHVMLDQPLAFVAALRSLLAAWQSEG